MPGRSLRTVAFIPARYASTRFPGKPVALIAGKPMIQHVYERVSEARRVDEVYVATDDRRIADVVGNFGGKYIMTSSSLRSGTDRCAEAARKVKADIIANIQGDEPVISPATIDAVVSALTRSPKSVMSTAAVRINDPALLESENVVKVVLARNGDALYFTRSVVPCLRGVDRSEYLGHHEFLKHLGIYVYRREFLKKLTKLTETPLESAEKLEQLRVLENGHSMRVAVVEQDTISVDVPSDVAAVEEYMMNITSKEKRTGIGKA